MLWLEKDLQLQKPWGRNVAFLYSAWQVYEKSAQTHIAVRLKSGNIGHYDNDLSSLLGHDSL